MLGQLKNLGRETLIYGLSTVVSRLLNVLLLPIYTYFMTPAEYGVVGTLFSYLAFLNILYAYGMDFAFMRFSSAGQEGAETRNFSTPFYSLLATSALFSAAITVCAEPVARLLGFGPELAVLIRYSAWILALDAAALVPFAELRLTHKAWVFVGVKVANIAINLVLTYVLLGPLHMGVRGVFLAGLVASSATVTMLTPVIARKLEPSFDVSAYGALLRFGLPLIPAGLASMVVQVIDRPILKSMTNDSTVGIYLANYKLGIFMQLVVNMFDAAWRPFILPKADDPHAKALMARVLTYFTLGGAAVVLFVSLFISRIVALPLALGRPLIHPSYWPGLPIVPVVLLGYLFNGIYVNFLAPVNLANRNDLVVYATGLGAAVNVIANLCLIPIWGIMGAAAATLAAYAAMAACLFALGRRVYPVDYEYSRLLRIGLCFGVLAYAGHAQGGRGAGQALFRLGLCAAFPLLLAATGFLREDERHALRGLWR